MEDSAKKLTKTKPRVIWNNENVTKTFLEACIREAADSGKQGGSFGQQSWRKVIKILKESHNFVVDQKQTKNRFDYIRYKYQAWCRLRNKSQNVYDASTNTFNLSEEEWDQEIQTNPKAKTLKTSPLLFPDLCIQLFDGVSAGVNILEPTSTRSRVYSTNESEVHEVDYSIVLVPGRGSFEESNVSNPNPEKVTPQVQENKDTRHDESQRPRKKSKQLVNQSNNSQFEENMCKALEIIIQKQNGPTNMECRGRLKSLGWSAENPLYQLALGIFCESASHREAWMNLEEDEAEIWVKMISRKLGLSV
ncbi:uncharacterized protein LOC141725080 isoform X1 [Apium graveolens]|uniref:uncharacterized protein LOC141725080 isoform X1 n=1 Tax=Apium graveolens TaxID=4045 RepID=UPI003D7A1FCF